MNHVQFQAPPLTKVNKVLLIATGATFIASSILQAIGAFSLVRYLGLSGSGLLHGLIYQFLTYPLVETQFMSFLFNSLIVWFIGSELESQWGQKIYLRFLLINIIAVGLIFSLVSILILNGTTVYLTPLHGLSGINFALLMAYAILYPDRHLSLMMIFPMRARTFCWILAGIEAYFAIFSSAYTSWAHIFAMGVSYLVIHFQSKPLIKRLLNSTWQPKKSGKKHLYVVKDDDQNPPKYWQ
ncbi:MAG: rhomboid family intramembrane serine protease [Bacteriovoracaceae bacterium]